MATHALSIFGDHSDVMASRTTGFAMLCSSSVQEAHDFAAVAHAATLGLAGSLPALLRRLPHIPRDQPDELLGEDDLRALVGEAAIDAHRHRGLLPDHPVLRGSAQNPDVFFQAREAAKPYHAAVPGIVEAVLADGGRHGRGYGLVESPGRPDAERVVVIMGSGVGAVSEAVDALIAEVRGSAC